MLSKWNQFYYELGMLLTQLNNRECERIKDSLLSVRIIINTIIKHKKQ